MNIPKITPTPKGSKISLGVLSGQYNKNYSGADYYANLANIIVETCNGLTLPYTEGKVREYAKNRERLKADYLQSQTEGINNSRLKKIAEHEALTDFEKVCRLSGLSHWQFKGNAQEYDQFVTYEPTKAKPFSVNITEVQASTEHFLSDDDLPKYDLHRLIAALLTQFLGAEIEKTLDIADFFHLTEDKQIIPYIEQRYYDYPPKGNEIKTEL